MIANMQNEIKELENYIGYSIKRREITLELNEPHDETFSYNLCKRFYGKNKELKRVIDITIEVIIKLMNHDNKDNDWKKEISLFFSLLGDMYYIKDDFNKSINCFMKSLNYNKSDITNWIGLMFSLRAYGEVDIFENLIFNFEHIYYSWKKDPSWEMTEEKIYELTRKSF